MLKKFLINNFKNITYFRDVYKKNRISLPAKSDAFIQNSAAFLSICSSTTAGLEQLTRVINKGASNNLFMKNIICLNYAALAASLLLL